MSIPSKNSPRILAASQPSSKQCQNHTGNSLLSLRHSLEMKSSTMLSKGVPDWNESVSTLRHTSYKYAFSGSPRFNYKDKENMPVLMITIPSTMTKKTCTFGIGSRDTMSSQTPRATNQTPSPGSYDLGPKEQGNRKSGKGKSFGIAWSYYKKVFTNHRKDAHSEMFSEHNPPADYEVREKFGKGKRSALITGRLKMIAQEQIDASKNSPGPQYFIRDRHLQNMAGLNERNFSVGQRTSFASGRDTPGPIYQIAGFTDKFQTLKRKKAYWQ